MGRDVQWRTIERAETVNDADILRNNRALMHMH